MIFSIPKALVALLVLAHLAAFAVAENSSAILQTRESSFYRKLKTMGSILIKVQICYNRYNLCVKLVSPYFCYSSTGSKAFYLWAKRIASNIMKGNRDNFNVDCTPQFTKEILHGSLAPLLRNVIQ